MLKQSTIYRNSGQFDLLLSKGNLMRTEALKLVPKFEGQELKYPYLSSKANFNFFSIGLRAL